MTPIHFPEANKTFVSAGAAPLPAHVATSGLVTTCWQLPWRERLRLLWSGRLWAQTNHSFLGLDLVAPKLAPNETLRIPDSSHPQAPWPS